MCAGGVISNTTYLGCNPTETLATHHAGFQRRQDFHRRGFDISGGVKSSAMRFPTFLGQVIIYCIQA